jgi:hypothetical protein
VTGQPISLLTSGVIPPALVNTLINASAVITDLNQNAAGNFANRIEQNTLNAGLRPNPQFAAAAYLSNGADSNYNSLQLTLRRRFANGLLFNSSWTWSKAIDNQSSDPVGTSGTPGAGGGGLIDSNNLRENRARANWDRTHVWTTTWIYELPFGRDRKWMNSSSGIVNALVGGWSISGFNAMMTGSPFSILSGVRTAIGSTNSRAVLASGTALPDASLKKNTGRAQPGPYFFEDASAFTYAPPGSIGMGRNVFTGPGYWDVDASITKSFRIRETSEVMFRLEAFNALNHVNYRSLGDTTVGSNSITSANFGTACCQTRPTATSTAIVSNGEAYRVIQAVLKIVF